MFARSLSWAFAIFVTGASAVVAQQGAISIPKLPTQTLQMLPGFQREIVLQGNAKIGTIHVGDEAVARVAAVSDRQFVITALPLGKDADGATRQTNILVRDTNQNVIADLVMEVGYPSTPDTRQEVEIHKLGKSVEKYLCSDVKCDLVPEK